MPRNSCGWKLAGTETFRASSAKLLGRWGTNMQNIEKSLRKIYIPDENKVFVQVDQSGAEALIVAYLTSKGNFRDLFIHGVKPHVFVALHVFADEWKSRFIGDVNSFLCASPASLRSVDGFKELDKLIKSSDNWMPSERFYFIAKMICHASNYGMKAPTFCVNVLEKSDGKIRLTRKQAEGFLGQYHALFPEIRQWHNQIESILRVNKTLKNLFGFPRTFYGAWGDDLLKEAFAFVPQSTVGCITHKAFTALQGYIEHNNLDWDLLNNCHDSYLLQCPVGEEIEAAKVMREFMEIDLIGWDKTPFKMKSEASIGYSWGELTPI
jgi:DNA polymerase I-like protein with 3'-5' exonuclease and polymerase domains